MSPLTLQQTLDLALAHHRAGRLAEAEPLYREVLAVEPHNADVVHLLGMLAYQAGHFALALDLLQRSIAANPGVAHYYGNLGSVLTDLHRCEEAVAALEKAIELRPEAPESYYNLGNARSAQRRWEPAIAAFRRSLALRPDHRGTVLNLGTALAAAGQTPSAIALYQAALDRDPADAIIASNLGNLLKEQGLIDEAIASFRQALQWKPDFAEAHNNLGIALKDRGELEPAMASFRRALQLQPELSEAHSNLIFTLDLLETATLDQQQEERRRWYEAHGQRFAAQIAPHPNAPDPGRRLRVGYVSADFRRHSAYAAFGPVICGHDPAECEVFCYSGVACEDDETARLRGVAQGWRSTLGMTDEELAQQIRRDRIDILVDLSGHSSGNRLLVFARKPAPVQVTAWGHATGTGLQTMDYLFSDPVSVPAEQRGRFAEEVVDLPCCLCYEPPEYLPEVVVLPASEGHPLTYGCVNRLEKITDRAMSLWGRILRSRPGARLLVKDKRLSDAGVRQAFLSRLLRCGGIEESRVLIFGATPHAEHLRIFHQIDIGLDPFPQCGGASTGEALWMGVPVVTLQGATLPGRTSASILHAVGLREWIASSEEEYVRIAVEAGGDWARVARLRMELRTLLRASPYGDVRRYTHAVEQAYRRMWRTWCAKQCASVTAVD